MKVAVHLPCGLTEGDGGVVVTGVPSYVTVMPVSLVPKPLPVIITEVPGTPLILLSEMVGVTVKLISGTLASCVEEPNASMGRGAPEAAAGTTKLAVQLPWGLAEGDAGFVAI
jgi:hypothetical protein